MAAPAAQTVLVATHIRQTTTALRNSALSVVQDAAQRLEQDELYAGTNSVLVTQNQ